MLFDQIDTSLGCLSYTTHVSCFASQLSCYKFLNQPYFLIPFPQIIFNFNCNFIFTDFVSNYTMQQNKQNLIHPSNEKNSNFSSFPHQISSESKKKTVVVK